MRFDAGKMKAHPRPLHTYTPAVAKQACYDTQGKGTPI